MSYLKTLWVTFHSPKIWAVSVWSATSSSTNSRVCNHPLFLISSWCKWTDHTEGKYSPYAISVCLIKTRKASMIGSILICGHGSQACDTAYSQFSLVRSCDAPDSKSLFQNTCLQISNLSTCKTEKFPLVISTASIRCLKLWASFSHHLH